MALRGTSKGRPPGQQITNQKITNQKIQQLGWKKDAAHVILTDVTEEQSEDERSENESFDESCGEESFNEKSMVLKK